GETRIAAIRCRCARRGPNRISYPRTSTGRASNLGDISFRACKVMASACLEWVVPESEQSKIKCQFRRDLALALSRRPASLARPNLRWRCEGLFGLGKECQLKIGRPFQARVE